MPSENGETDTEHSEHDIGSSVGGRSTPRHSSLNQSMPNKGQAVRQNSMDVASNYGRERAGSDSLEKQSQASSNIEDDVSAKAEIISISTSGAPSGTITRGPLPAAVSPEQCLLGPKLATKQDAGYQTEGDNYFVPRAAKRKSVDASSRATSSSTLASSGFSFAESLPNSNSAPHSPQASTVLSDEAQASLPQMTSTPTSHPKPPRPTSVPVLSTNITTTRKRRDGPEYPRYPNQSFTALQSQQYHQPHPLRTRSSHPSQNSSYSSIPSRSSGDNISLASGAKTVGNTPAQSPSLFSPIYPANRNQVEESEDSQTSTPLLHPAHMQTPKETHKLQKDIDPISGRRLVNNYEMLKKLGSGQHGTVKLARNLDTGEMVAIKIVRRFSRRKRLGKTGDTADMIKKEVAILKQARHAHVVSLIEVIDDEEFGKVYLILEFVTRGEIVWRKKTDKDVAIFEMNRLKREKTDAVNEEYEKAEIERFNKLAVLRRGQKVQVLEEHGDRSLGDAESRPETNWSLEYGGESEDEGVQTTIDYSALDTYSRPVSMYDESSLPDSTHDLLSSVAPETPRPGATFQVDEDPPSIWSGGSLPNSPAHLAGTMYGPYVGQEQSNQNALPSILDKYIQLQTDWTEEETEYMYVPCLTISQALDAFRDTILGLGFLHFQGIIHRDIKPANLLWTADHRVKISDFGVSYLGKPVREDDNQDEMPETDAANMYEAIELAKTVGTPAFYAPELCDPELFTDERKATRPPITGQIDVWALGVTLYCMIFGRVPFHHENMFVLYEKIAREELFIPRFRLKGVEDTPKTPMNSNKRFDDIVEYEEVDNELRDLFQRLLNKDPLKRITIKEVKHHPWVLRGIANPTAWIHETDPDLQNAGRKIEVSSKDVQEAVVGLTIVDRLKSGFKRMGSALRGRNRRRAESELKATEASGSSSSPKTTYEVSHDRRSSLRGDEQIFTALRASRETPEHPLAQSVTASPEIKTDENYFDDANTLMMASHSSSYHLKRPSPPERAISTAESMKTIRPHVPPEIRESSPPYSSSLAPTKTVIDPNSQSSLGGIFGGAGRRFASKIRSRERGRAGDSNSNESSRSSSVSADPLALALEDPHGSPSLGFSTAVAAGHVDQPPALREDIPYSTTTPSSRPALLKHSSSEAFQKAKDLNERRRIEEFSRESNPSGLRHRATSSAANIPCPPSPDDDRFPSMHSMVSAFPADETTAFGVSSSSDQLASGISESFSHPSIPSVVSGASSLSGTIEASELKPISPSTIVPKRVNESADYLEDDPAELTPREDDTHLTAEDDEAGYNGEGELDSDSDDGGLEMGGSSKIFKSQSPAPATT